jgi:uncharacterized membrane protein
MAIFFVLAGARHFITPEYYELMMPKYLPVHLHRTLIYISGFFAILGGVGLMIPRLRSFSAWGIMSLLLAVLPANIYMWTHNVELPNSSTPGWFLLLRIPLQFLLIAWIYMFTKNPKDY